MAVHTVHDYMPLFDPMTDIFCILSQVSELFFLDAEICHSTLSLTNE